MLKLEIKQEFNTPVASLFKAWSNPEVIKMWFAPGDMTVPEARANVSVGGEYRFVMQNAEGEQFIVGGQYLEVVDNEKLVFSWQWEGSDNVTHVTVLFSKVDDGRSALELVHSEFEDQDACDKHNQGWQGCLANLPKALA